MNIAAHKKIIAFLNLLSAIAKIALSGFIYFVSALGNDLFEESESVRFFTDIGFFISSISLLVGILLLISSVIVFVGKNWGLYLLALVNALLMLTTILFFWLGFPFPVFYPITYLLITLYIVFIIYKEKTQYKLSSVN